MAESSPTPSRRLRWIAGGIAVELVTDPADPVRLLGMVPAEAATPAGPGVALVEVDCPGAGTPESPLIRMLALTLSPSMLEHTTLNGARILTNGTPDVKSRSTFDRFTAG